MLEASLGLVQPHLPTFRSPVPSSGLRGYLAVSCCTFDVDLYLATEASFLPLTYRVCGAMNMIFVCIQEADRERRERHERWDIENRDKKVPPKIPPDVLMVSELLGALTHVLYLRVQHYDM